MMSNFQEKSLVLKFEGTSVEKWISFYCGTRCVTISTKKYFHEEIKIVQPKKDRNYESLTHILSHP